MAASGGIITCTGTYTVTQQDLDSGGPLTNNITASACTASNKCNGNEQRVDSTPAVQVSVAVVASPSFSIQSVTVSPTAPTPPATSFTLNQPIVYTYTLRNLGNVTLTLASPPITDAMITGAYTCNRTSLTPPGPDANNPFATSIATCTGTHPVTQADLDAGLIPSRQVTASATFKTQALSAIGQAPAVTTFRGPRLSLQIAANPTTFPEAGQTILYTYTLTNTGTIPLNGPYSVTSVSGPTVSVDCSSAASPLVSGASTTCSGFANVSGPSGSSVVHTANARASDGTQQITSNNASATVTNPVLGCTAVAANPNSFAKSGSSMSMSVNNPLAVALQIKNITVSWNHDLGHGGKNNDDHTLKLQSISIGGGSNLSTGTQNGPNYTFTPSTPQFIPASTPGTIFTFNFNQSYDIWEAGPEAKETVTITFDTPGCESVVITLQRP
jgi:hypothetical protein